MAKPGANPGQGAPKASSNKKSLPPAQKDINPNLLNLSKVTKAESVLDIDLDKVAKHSQAILINPPWASETPENEGLSME